MLITHPHEKIWFTSDTHYGHSDNLGFFGRPFKSVEEGDAALIANHNALVQPDDIVFHLGDFTWGGGPDFALAIRRQLNGKLYLVEGNHDKDVVPIYDTFAMVSKYMEIGVKDYDVYGGVQMICLFHFPILAWNNARQGWWHLFGHTHGDVPPMMNGKSKACAMDVGVDANQMKPINYAQIKEQFAAWKEAGAITGYVKPDWTKRFPA